MSTQSELIEALNKAINKWTKGSKCESMDEFYKWWNDRGGNSCSLCSYARTLKDNDKNRDKNNTSCDYCVLYDNDGDNSIVCCYEFNELNETVCYGDYDNVIDLCEKLVYRLESLKDEAIEEMKINEVENGI